jgi:hypothetical protein
MIAWFHINHIRPDRLNNPRRLVSEHRRHLTGIKSLLEMNIAVTNTSRRRPNQNLVTNGIGNINIFDTQRLMGFA